MLSETENTTTPDSEDEWLRYRGAARLVGATPGTLMVWVCTGRYGLPFYKIGKNVRFKRSELLRWLQARRKGGDANDSASRHGPSDPCRVYRQ
jgi:excisionase family DNA binding protein